MAMLSYGLKHGISRTNPYNAGLLQNICRALCLWLCL